MTKTSLTGWQGQQLCYTNKAPNISLTRPGVAQQTQQKVNQTYLLACSIGIVEQSDHQIVQLLNKVAIPDKL